MARLMAVFSGVRRREGGKPKLSLRAGDLSEPITVRSQGYDQRHARGWWPAGASTWMTTKPYSNPDIADYGLTMRCWAPFPGSGAVSLQPHLFPVDYTVLIISSPTFIASPAQIRSYTKGGWAPPPPPAEEESS